MVVDIVDTPAIEFAERIRNGSVSPVKVVDEYLERIDELNPILNAYVSILRDESRDRAKEIEAKVKSGEDPGPLSGVPIALKDLFAFKAGVPNTFGATPFRDYTPKSNSILVDRLESAGAIILGKTNTPEFGRKANTTNELFGPTRNPFDLTKSAGGSSGGSASAVAAGLALIAQGSDVAGSIRIPASACGVFGLKPTPGRIAHVFRPNGYYGLSPYVDHGPISRRVSDAAVALDVMSGFHPRDPRSVPNPIESFSSATEKDVGNFRIGYSPNMKIFKVGLEVEEKLEEALDSLGDSVATVDKCDPDFDRGWEEYHSAMETLLEIMYADMASGFSHSHGVDLIEDYQDQIIPEAVSRIEKGRKRFAIDLKKAQILRTEMLDTFERIFEQYDLFITPTLSVPIMDIDADYPAEIDGEKIDPREWFLTWPFNLTGHPVASVPIGLSSDGLPIGAQIVGSRFDESTLLAMSAAFERNNPWYTWYEKIPNSIS